MKIKHAILMIWTATLVAFPLIALTEAPSDALLEYLPIAAIGIAFLVSVIRAPSHLVLKVGAAALFCSLAYGGLFLYSNQIYNPDKLSQFLIVVLIFGIMLGISLQEQMFLERLPIALLCVGGIALALFALNPSIHQEGRATYGDGNPIWMARTLSLFGVAAVWLIIDRQKQWAWGLLLISFGAITLTGSRGPLLSLAATALYGLILLQRRSTLQTAIIIGATFFALALIQIGFDIIPQLRALNFASGTGREILYRYAIDLLIVHPKGLGIGHFQLDHFSYPHNIFLEFIVEWGWILGGIMVAVICWGSFRLLRMPTKFNILKLVLVMELLNSQLSGDITTPRMLYALVFVGLISEIVRQKDIVRQRRVTHKAGPNGIMLKHSPKCKI